MQNSSSSPKVGTNKSLLSSHLAQSPKVLNTKARALQGSESPDLNEKLPVIPSNTSAQAKLFGQLSSVENKQLDSKLSYKQLSSSLVEAKTGEQLQSPKTRNIQAKTTSAAQDYYVKNPGKNVNQEEDAVQQAVKSVSKGNLNLDDRVRGHHSSLPDTQDILSQMIASKDEKKNTEGSSANQFDSSPSKLGYKEVGSPLYKKDVTPLTLPERDVVIKNDFYDQYHSTRTVGLQSTMKEDFKPWEVPNFVRRQGLKSRLGQQKGPFTGKSNYQWEYMNFESPKPFVEKGPGQKTVLSELPFKATSSYRETFIPSPEPLTFVTRWVPHREAKSPFPTGIPTFSKSTTSSTYVYAASPKASY